MEGEARLCCLERHISHSPTSGNPSPTILLLADAGESYFPFGCTCPQDGPTSGLACLWMDLSQEYFWSSLPLSSTLSKLLHHLLTGTSKGKKSGTTIRRLQMLMHIALLTARWPETATARTQRSMLQQLWRAGLRLYPPRSSTASLVIFHADPITT